MSWIKESTLNCFHYLVVKILKSGEIPKHVAFIMDGNRRYANKKQIEKIGGHTQGFHKLTETLQWCLDLGIEEVTVYAFSIENFKRSKEEVDELMELARQKFQSLINEKQKLMENGICVRIIGNLDLLPENLRKLMAEAIIITKNNSKAFLNIAFAYTSRDEMTYAIKDILKGIRDADILPEDINEDLISKCLYTYNSPNPDLLIRTSGEIRLSDFLIWQVSNSCIYFADVLWPEFSAWDLFGAIFYYQRCYTNLQNITKAQNITNYNSRVTNYLNKLYNERQIMLQKRCGSEILASNGNK
ncbi:dehydrodolichyl diphosphate synthase complex subunit DHDDS [Polistes fuscatus]|uniref:dehydrodolichyl diphosphate synthase complex subunit DHDDS n=1 Tax=Polistes fuscatus TaxID=30207 RepID=UPI001CA9D19A|nr:dehydrodolichyl diphosphate synthase complex subunit DHDDS [Polistes fuscatus]XP_043504817.1 dehydrodolichyl diphosphate synthase complex subunit DHDDS [Polistes fuscatus]XP_043504818.1 dehydrodolichyl diphosphate synthase complex subunit DHDDS [Polistes fuscatus]XP_043504819.1 dehydrodolichyl diphosphate synthase complex subunit DHDDS [Polistes fuscatus]